MLVSFQLASKHPDSLIELFDNLESLAKDPTCFEVLVKVDTEDPQTQAVVAGEVARRKFKLRALVTPRRRGYEDLWIALNELFHLTDPSVYFVCNINDEVRIKQKGWDERLARYIGLFPDNIFRLRTSKLKFRNYYDFWECGFAPENYAFFTKRWLDICGDWNPCFGPDSSQQYVAYYLAYGNYPGARQFNRDIPILDISWRNEGVGLNLSERERRRRTSTNFRLWMRQVSHPMQEEFYRRARRLQASITQAENAENCDVRFYDERARKMIILYDGDDRAILDALPYKLNRALIIARNLYRAAHFSYYAGGGREAHNILPLSLLDYYSHRYPRFRDFVSIISPRQLAGQTSAKVRGRLEHPRVQSIIEHEICRGLGYGVSLIARPFLLFGILTFRSIRAITDMSYEAVVALMNETTATYTALVESGFRGLGIENKEQQQRAGKRWVTLSRILILSPIYVGPGFTLVFLALVRSVLRSFNTASLDAILNGGWWRSRGRRLALTLKDRDPVWLRIDTTHQARIAMSRSPWHDLFHPVDHFADLP
jgi:hypothetical protein